MPERTCVNERDPDRTFMVPSGPAGDFYEAPELAEWAELIIQKKLPDFPEGVVIRYLWKARGGAPGGKLTMGKCKKLSGDTEYYAGADYEIWLAADHLAEQGLTNFQVEALLYHELLHVLEEKDEEKGISKLSVRPHDNEVFIGEIEHYGFWDTDIANLARAVQGRLALGETVPEAPAFSGSLGAVVEKVVEEVNAGALGEGVTAEVKKPRGRKAVAEAAAT